MKRTKHKGIPNTDILRILLREGPGHDHDAEIGTEAGHEHRLLGELSTAARQLVTCDSVCVPQFTKDHKFGVAYTGGSGNPYANISPRCVCVFGGGGGGVVVANSHLHQIRSSGSDS